MYVCIKVLCVYVCMYMCMYVVYMYVWHSLYVYMGTSMTETVIKKLQSMCLSCVSYQETRLWKSERNQS